MNILLHLFLDFFKIGFFTIGGGYAMLPLIEREVVEKRKWVNKEEIIDIFAVSQSIPGAIAINSASFIGYKVAGYAGAICATLGVVVPSFFIIISIAGLFLKYHESALITAAFSTIGAAVIALILSAGYRIAKNAIVDNAAWIIFALSLILLLVFKIHAFIVILAGGFFGILWHLLFNKRKEE